ncbi:MAG TPA: tRNA (N(6)-L-threonylcarbamoyladenosine(37)-C(2))-methylthiotransferase MtaB [Bacteroidota bacterium]
MKTVALHTLGCKLNFAETSSIGGQFRERGYRVVDFSQPSDVFVLNTCSVTERADRECRQLIRRVRRRSPETYIIVMGCYAQLRPEAIASIEGVDLVLGAKEKFNLFDYSSPDMKEAKARILVSPVDQAVTIGQASSAASDRTRAFLKIQDGCDYSCSFCTIPLARGSSRSQSLEEVYAQASQIASGGYREIVLTGVNVGDYGKKIHSDLQSLLARLVSIDGIERIRISSIEPNLLTDNLLDFWLSQEKLCKHFHIPLQSGDDAILGLMRRRYRSDYYEERVQRIKSSCPDACIGADVLVGFPGETNELFDSTYSFLRDVPLSYLHVFTYSERPNTDAILLKDVVEPRIRAERSERLRTLGIRKRKAFHDSFVGKTVEVLFEGERLPGVWSGLTDRYIRVEVESKSALGNTISRVKVVKSDGEKCLGQLVPGAREATLAGASLSPFQWTPEAAL